MTLTSTGENRLESGKPTVLMLLTNAYDPDPRVREEALALVRMGCNVRVLAWDRDRKAASSECVESVEVERIKVASRHGRGTTQLVFYVWLYIRMLWRGLQTTYDAVHCHDLDTLPLGFLLGKLKRKPIIYDAHESFPDMIAGSVHPFVCRCLTHLEDVLIRRTALLITVGEKLRAYFASRGAMHSVVVGNWKRTADFNRTPDQRATVRGRLGIPRQSLTVVCITNLLPDRKLNELLDAIDATPDVYAIIGGRGVLQSHIEARAIANPRIVYVGFAQGRQIADYTCAADVVYYGFDDKNPNARFSAPNKLFEALAAGRPLITGDFGEIADVVRRAGCGVVLDCYSPEHISRSLAVLLDAEKRTAMAANALQVGRTEMNWAHAEDTLCREYSVLLGRPLQLPDICAAAAAPEKSTVA